MIYAFISIFFGWLFSLVGADDLLNNLMGLNTQGYYIVWFVTGLFIWMKHLFVGRD